MSGDKSWVELGLPSVWASMNNALGQSNSDSAYPVTVGRHWSEKMATGMTRCIDVHETVGAD